MTHSSSQNILGKFASVVTLFGGALYYTGWIYRWAYFSFFQLEVTTLDLPHQSFLFVPLQIFFGSFSAWDVFWGQFVKAILWLLVAIYILIPLTLWLVEKASVYITKILNTFCSKLGELPGLKRTQLKLVQFQPINFQQSLWDELIAVVWILIILFHLASQQGLTDARRDAGINSLLPVVTMVVPDNGLAFGQAESGENLSNIRIIGDRARYEQLLIDATNDLDSSVVWRVVLDRDGYFYLFKTLPDNAKMSDRPVLLVVPGSLQGDRLLILSPEPSLQ